MKLSVEEVGILVRKNRGMTVNSVCYDFDNRIIGLELNISNYVCNIFNIYAPNGVQDQNDFIDNLCEIITSKKKVILGGDFNAVENSDKDRMSVSNTEYVLKRNEQKWC